MKTLKTCLLTGASGGIGHAIAKALDKEGYTLILHGRNKDKLTQLQSQLSNPSIIVTGDLSRVRDRENILNKAFQFGPVDLLINNAGISCFSDLETTSSRDIEQLIHLNLTVPILMTQAFVKRTGTARTTLVNVGSALGAIGFPGFSVYSASKFGLRGFTESLSREMQGTHTRVLYFAPRTTLTDINSVQAEAMNQALGNKVDSPEFVAQELLALLKGNKVRKSVGWPEKFFARVNGVFPGLVDKAIAGKLKTIKQFSHSHDSEVLHERF